MPRLLMKNQGVLDRVVRVAVGAGALALTVTGPKTWWGMVGVIPLLTGLSGRCPVYGLLGVSTRKT